MKEFLVYKPNGPTVATTSSGTATNVALPTTTGGTRSKYILVSVEITKEAFIKPVVSGSEGADSTMLHVSSDTNPLVLNVSGNTHLRILQKTASAIVYMTPIDAG